MEAATFLVILIAVAALSGTLTFREWRSFRTAPRRGRRAIALILVIVFAVATLLSLFLLLLGLILMITDTDLSKPLGLAVL